MAERKCSRCGKPMNSFNPTHICYVCQDKLADQRWRAIESPFVEVKDIAEVLVLSKEQVRRLWREGRLPPALSLTKKLRWDKEFFLNWIRSQHKAPPVLGRQFEAFIEAHGGLHADEATGALKLGQKEKFQIAVYSKGKDGRIVRERVVLSGIISGHYDT